MAGSAVANQTGPEAAYANGAALAGQEGLSISASGSMIYLASIWTNPLGASGTAGRQDTIPKAAFPPDINLAYGLKLGEIPVAAGFAFAVPYGGLVYWPTTWAGNARVIHVDRRVYSYDFAFAAQPIPQAKLSLAGTLYQANEKLEQGLDFGSNEGDVQLATSGTGLGWSAAAEVKPLRDLPLRIGLQYKHQSVLHLSGESHFEGVPASFQTQGLIDSNVTHKLVVPNILHAGASYDVLPGLTADFAITFWRYVVYRDDVFAGDKGLTVVVPRDYSNAMTYRLGGEYRLPMLPELTIRSGILRDVTPQPTSTLDPSLPESSRWAWSVGATYQILPQLSVSLANEVAWFDTATTTGPNAFPGTYATHADILSVGLIYKMK